ncbi:hypothetical protein KAZ66_00735 [Candidatus Woesebacteria bacterium]|nr:hypothetical protein [Candidatus Woesebacteria bacterium]
MTTTYGTSVYVELLEEFHKITDLPQQTRSPLLRVWSAKANRMMKLMDLYAVVATTMTDSEFAERHGEPMGEPPVVYKVAAPFSSPLTVIVDALETFPSGAEYDPLKLQFTAYAEKLMEKLAVVTAIALKEHRNRHAKL